MEDEKLQGFPADWTYQVWNAKRRRQDPRGFLDTRGRLLGNCYNPIALSILLADLAYERGLIREPAAIKDLILGQARLRPAVGVSPQAALDEARRGVRPELGMETMVRWLLLQQTARGGEIKNLLGAPHARGRWHEVPAEWFEWENIISIPWRHRSDRIAVCEARARNLALRARARVPSLHQQRFVHLLDSQTNLAQIAKGRTGSQQMAHVHRQSAAVSLAAGFREVESYTRSDKNPADKGSRNYEEWRRARRAHTSSKAGAHKPRQAQGGLRPEP